MGAILFVAGWLTQIYTQIIDEDDLYAKENYHDAKAFDEFKAIRPHFRWVQRRVYRYRDKGLAGLANRSLPGQPTQLAKERVKTFEDRIAAGQPGTQSHRAALAGFSGSRRVQ